MLNFSKMLMFIKKMQSSVSTGLEINKYSWFQQAWVLPKNFENIMDYFKKFIAMDGAHCTSCHSLILLAVTFLDRKKRF